MARRTAIDELSNEHKQQLDEWLIANHFSDYEYLEKWLRELGYKIGKSSLHRYGQKLEQQHKAEQEFHALKLDEYEKRLITLYRSMSDEGREALVCRLFFEKDKEQLKKLGWVKNNPQS